MKQFTTATRRADQFHKRPLTASRATLVAALACIATVACGCGASSNSEAKPASPRAAAALFASLRRLPTFRQSQHCGGAIPGAYIACFQRRPSIVLSKTRFLDLVRQSGIRPRTDTVTCVPPNFRTSSRLKFTSCSGRATLGAAQLVLNMTSVVTTYRTALMGTSRSLPSVPGGTVYSVTDVGNRKP